MIKTLNRIMAMVMILFLTTAAAKSAGQEDKSMANYKEDIVNVELENGNIHRSFLHHSIGCGDDMANRFGVRLFRNGVPEDVAGSCLGYFIRADGRTVPIENGASSGNMAYITLTEECYEIEGQFSLVIKISSSTTTTTMRIVDGIVSRTSTSEIVDPGTIIPSIDDLIDAINNAVASIPQDYSDLQKTSAEVDSTANLLRNDGYFWKIGSNDKLDTGTYANISLFEKIRCTYGNVFRIQTTGLGTAPAYIVTDGALNILASGPADRYDGTLTITQQDAYYLCINCANDDIPSMKVYQTNNKSQEPIKGKMDNLERLFNKYFIPSQNIRDLSDIGAEQGYYNDDGTYQDSASYRHYTIPVEPSTTYKLSAFRHYITFWDYALHCFTSASEGTGGAVTRNATITTPANCRFIRITFAETTDADLYNNFTMTEGTAAFDEKETPYPTLSSNVIIDGFTGVIPEEIFSPVIEMKLGGVIDDSTGKIEYSASTNLAASDVYYPMRPGAKYIFWGDVDTRYNVYFYDKDKTFVEALVANSDTKTVQTVYVNENNYAYMRIGAYRYGGISDHLYDVHFVTNTRPRKVVCLGDSMTAGNGADVIYHMYLARRTGWTCQNWGVGGAGWAWNMTGSTTVGNGIEGKAPSGVTPQYDTDFAHAVEVVPDDADLYIVFGGYNDWNMDKTEQQMELAAETVLSYLQNNVPGCRILVVTPQQRYKAGGKDGRDQSGAGMTLHEYGEIIKGVCELHAVKCIDLYTESGLYPYSAESNAENFDEDGLHLNSKGQKRVFETIVNECIAMMSR